MMFRSIFSAANVLVLVSVFCFLWPADPARAENPSPVATETSKTKKITVRGHWRLQDGKRIWVETHQAERVEGIVDGTLTPEEAVAQMYAQVSSSVKEKLVDWREPFQAGDKKVVESDALINPKKREELFLTYSHYALRPGRGTKFQWHDTGTPTGTVPAAEFHSGGQAALLPSDILQPVLSPDSGSKLPSKPPLVDPKPLPLRPPEPSGIDVLY